MTVSPVAKVLIFAARLALRKFRSKPMPPRGSHARTAFVIPGRRQWVRATRSPMSTNPESSSALRLWIPGSLAMARAPE
jgi:hypothetical protein